MKYLVIILIALVTACNNGKSTYTYIETSRGIVISSGYYCDLGLLVSNDRRNVYDENGRTITCSGYIKLTKEQADNWEPE